MRRFLHWLCHQRSVSKFYGPLIGAHDDGDWRSVLWDSVTDVEYGADSHGIGGGIITLAETTVTDLVPLRHRATYLGYLGSGTSILSSQDYSLLVALD